MTEQEIQYQRAQVRALKMSREDVDHAMTRLMQGGDVAPVLAFLASCQDAAMAQVTDRAQGGEARHYNAGVLHAFLHLKSVLRGFALTSLAHHRTPTPEQIPIERPG